MDKITEPSPLDKLIGKYQTQIQKEINLGHYQTEKQLEELKDKISDDDKKSITEHLEQLKKDKDSKDIEKVKASLENLNKVWSEISENIYKQSQNEQKQQQPADQKSKASSKDEVKDADFEVVEDDAKK